MGGKSSKTKKKPEISDTFEPTESVPTEPQISLIGWYNPAYSASRWNDRHYCNKYCYGFSENRRQSNLQYSAVKQAPNQKLSSKEAEMKLYSFQLYHKYRASNDSFFYQTLGDAMLESKTLSKSLKKDEYNHSQTTQSRINVSYYTWIANSLQTTFESVMDYRISYAILIAIIIDYVQQLEDFLSPFQYIRHFQHDNCRLCRDSFTTPKSIRTEALQFNLLLIHNSKSESVTARLQSLITERYQPFKINDASSNYQFWPQMSTLTCNGYDMPPISDQMRDIIFLIFSVSNMESFITIREQCPKLKQSLPNAAIFLIGAGCDEPLMTFERVVSGWDAMALAKQNDLPYIDVSAECDVHCYDLLCHSVREMWFKKAGHIGAHQY